MTGNTDINKLFNKRAFLFGVLFVFLLLAPNFFSTNNNQAFAQSLECTVVSARFYPSSINGVVDEKFMDEFYDKDAPPEFKILAHVINCEGQDIYVGIVEEDASGDNYVDIGKTEEDSFYYSLLPFVPGPKTTVSGKDSTITFVFRAGTDECEDGEYGPDCDLHFNIYNKDKKMIYHSEDRESQGGSLDYDEDGPDKSFIFIRSNEEQGDTVGTIWYFETVTGSFIPSSGGKVSSKQECEAEAGGAAGAKKPINCTSDPDVDKIVSGALNGKSDLVPKCVFDSAIKGTFAGCVTTILQLAVLDPLNWLLGIAGKFFDFMFEFSIGSEIYGGAGSKIGFLKTAWTFIRDIANLGFILSLLWLSISQILKPEGDSFKKEIPKIIIIALLINFSFFFGTVIVDVTNVLARFFFTNNVICVNTDGKCDGSISEALVAAINPQNLINNAGAEFQKATGQATMGVGYYMVILIMCIYVSWKMFQMFFKAATLFLGRIAQIWVHLVMSPFAFIKYILPAKMSGVGGGFIQNSPTSWAGELFKNAMIAPLFMFFMYLLLLLLSKFDFAMVSDNSNMFIGLISMLFPFFVVTILMDAALNATKNQAGKIAGMAASIADKAIGAVTGGALALGAFATGGMIVKGGSKLLGGLGRNLVAKEGKGSWAGSRWLNSKQAKLGGYLNDYAKKLPDKKLDIRENKAITGFVKNATGFDLTSNKDMVNKNLSRIGIRPNESLNEKNERKIKDMEADIKRRQIDTQTSKTDRELLADYNERQADYKNNIEKTFKNNDKFTYEYIKAQKMQAKNLQGDKFNSEEWDKKFYEEYFKDKSDAFKRKSAGSEEMFNAKNRDEYKKAAESYNKRVEKDFVYKKKSNVYGGKTEDEIDANMEAGRKTGIGGIANLGDSGKAVLQGGATGWAASTMGLAAGLTGLGAGLGLYGAESNYQRDAELEFIRRRENKKDSINEKKSKKIKEEIAKTEASNARLELSLSDLTNKLNILSNDIKQNNLAFTNKEGKIVTLKDSIAEGLKKAKEADLKKDVKERKAPESLDAEAIRDAFIDFSKQLNTELREIGDKLVSTTLSSTDKANLENRQAELTDVLEKLARDPLKERYIKESENFDKKLSAHAKGKERIERLDKELKGEAAEKKEEKKTDDKK